ncbi:glycoside hydrolase family 2 protein [Hypomontagnella monticulosa]|nr:glycoside hydrolase family 2 protein [Hypomontagnella monticulosa]
MASTITRHEHLLEKLDFPVVANGAAPAIGRERVSLNAGWRFQRSTTRPDKLAYDRRPDINQSGLTVLKSWILPSANNFIKDPAKRHQTPTGTPGGDIPFVQGTYDDSAWEAVDLPHDWAIKGPFYTGGNVPVGGGMGRLPVQGVAWYRRKVTISPEDEGKSIYLDIDGAMSFAVVWINGNLVGGWPYGYSSFRVDLTTYLRPGEDNQLAIRLDNPVDSSRWYPGGGIYRNIWLTKVDKTHVAQSGTYITTKEVSSQSATVNIVVQVENNAPASRQVEVVTDIRVLDPANGEKGIRVAEFASAGISIPANQTQSVNSSITIKNPQLWGPSPVMKPNLYVATTRISADNQTIDTYETRFGIRSLTYDGGKGLLVNGEHVRVQGVNQHHDLGALGAAFNFRAAQRQLEILQDLGCNAIRMSHNPPAPELLDLADQMGFLVLDEVFDMWERQKTTNDQHLFFSDWHEPILRSFIRRDRNHPSIVAWSFGNEVGEQSQTGAGGAAIAQELHDIVREEDPTRPSTASMNTAKPDMPFPQALDIISLNYQGEGIRDSGPYAGLPGTKTPPIYPDFHKKFPEKVIWSSESAAALSTRGTYMFPVTSEYSAPVSDSAGGGGDPRKLQVSAYELYTAPFGASPDKVFATQDNHTYVAGEFPTPYYDARSSYFGIIDLAGFKKDRYHLYQARWRPDLKTAHILPHWTWPDRVGQVTPVHVFSAADEAEFASNYRFRWDKVVYQPGTLRVITFKNGEPWANSTVRTAGDATQIRLAADRATLKADSSDLSFVTAEILDSNGDGPGEIVATDNGNPADMTAFPSKERKAFNGEIVVITLKTE